MAAVAEGEASELRSNSIGLADVLFQSITYMAPGVGLVFSIGIAVGISGATLPLSVLVALVACTFAAVAIGQQAKHIPSAGGIYTYAAKGLGPRAGFLVGWFYVAFALFLPGSLFLVGGWFVAQFLDNYTSLGSNSWLIWATLFAVAFLALTYFDVRVSAKATIILGAIEIAVFLALGLTMIAQGKNSADPFTPSAGADSWNGIFQGAVFAILAFIGFEAATALGEEARDPRRTVPRAVVGACVLMGLFYVFMTYAWNAGAEMNIIGHYTKTGGSDWDAFGNQYWGGDPGAWILFFALVNSVIACGTAATNNAARVIFSMGRTGSLPQILGKVHPRHRSPYIAVLAVTAVTYLVALSTVWLFVPGKFTVGASAQFGFFIEATLFTIVAIFIYMTSCLSCIGYFSRGEGKPHKNALLHVVVPIVGFLAFVLPLYTQYFSLGNLFNDGKWFDWAYKLEDGSNVILGKDSPITFAVWGAALWLVIGVALAFYLGATRPEALERATHAFGGEDALDTGHAESMSITH